MNLYQRIKSSYYVPGADSNPARDRLKQLLYRRVPSFPRTVQIETRTGCNGACIFCPQGDTGAKLPRGAMPRQLFERIVTEIGREGVTTRVSPYLTNEPFLDLEIVEKSRFLRRVVPHCKVVITTNGGPLTAEIVEDIARDNPFRAIYISMQGIEKEAYERTMRGSLVFEETKRNVEYLIDQRNARMPELKIVITMVKTKEIDAEAAVRYWQSRGVEAKYTVLENRGGNLTQFEALLTGQKRRFRDCTRLFKAACITFDGDMVLCCTDYYRTMVLGNVRDRSIREVWNSPRASAIRRDFIRGDLRNNPLCARCAVGNL
jgi:radical SAM protein with 4Fe4S-binding SPASM domain